MGNENVITDLNERRYFSQDVFDIGVRQIEIFFNEPNWDDSLDIYYANNNGQRLIADSILIDGLLDEDVGIKYKGNSSYNVNNIKNPINKITNTTKMKITKNKSEQWEDSFKTTAHI